jgi:hypothetical protein
MTLVFDNGQRESDRTFFSMGSFGMTPRVPDLDELSDGDIVVFKGTSIVRGLTLEGKPADPLKFVVLRDAGLVYLKGSGRVVREDGSSFNFPQ